jgi:hypothetical protein
VIGRLLRITAWLLAGHVVVAGLFWAMLNVPESNVAMLGLSALLVIVLFVLEGLVGAGAVLLGASPGGWIPPIGRALRAVPSAVVALILYAAVRYIFTGLSVRYDDVTSQIDAWLIARLDWTRTAGLHQVVAWSLWGVGHALAASLALAVVVRGTLGVGAETGRLRWLTAAFSPVRLALLGVTLFVFVWLPWQPAEWRPTSLPVSIVEPIVAGIKLLVILTVIHVGLALLVWLAIRRHPVAADR